MKKFKVATLLCLIGICSIGESVLAKDDALFQAKSTQQVKQVMKEKVEEENQKGEYSEKIIRKLNIQKKVENKNYAYTIHRNVSKYEIAVLTRIVEAEATDKDVKSKILVANVVLNRVRTEEFPDTIDGVVFQRTQGQVQFSPIADGRYESVPITKDSEIAVERALSGEDYSKGALYFMEKTMATSSNVSWFESSLNHLFTYQGHSFYK